MGEPSVSHSLSALVLLGLVKFQDYKTVDLLKRCKTITIILPAS